MSEIDWAINIENAASEAQKHLGAAAVAFVFEKYDAHSVEDLPACYYSEVWDELSLMAEED